jgi:folate-binding protein YgfZ
MADAWVCDASDNRFYLLVPTATVDRLLESFDGQIIMEDVEPEVRADLAVISLVGPRAHELTARAKELGETFPVDRLGRGGLDVIVPRDRADDAECALGTAVEDAGGAAISSDGFELARIRAGRPRFGVDFDDRNYPQETGLEPRAVSFNKGCYLGQEVICMLENRGKLTKRLVSLELSGDAAPDAPIEDDGAEIGRVTTVGHDDGKTLAFGYVKRAHATPGKELHIGSVLAKVTAVIGADG